MADFLNSGQKLAQSAHVCFEFASNHPENTKKWMTESNYICILSTSSIEMFKILEKCNELNVAHSVFRESDLNNVITAIALEPGENSKNLCKKLKLA